MASWDQREAAWDGSTPLTNAWDQRLGRHRHTFRWQWQLVGWNGEGYSFEENWNAQLANIQGERQARYKIEVVMMARLTTRSQRIREAW